MKLESRYVPVDWNDTAKDIVNVLVHNGGLK
jgi:hypothetical protein